ncbi:flagellar biosynthesis protein FliQ [Cryptosporangium minutisporangium]|uniref:Flagellar biosynthetic protein FliQ n=1 Tax=Cryptosporangium minutisporangium TaxID=113569 RepID=A0ABP6TCV0_9ACTN
MTDAQILEIGLYTMTVIAKLSAPILLTTLAIGFLISLFQSVTQIQEQTLSFVPKAIAAGAALLLAGNWMLQELVSYTTQLYARIPTLLSGS